MNYHPISTENLKVDTVLNFNIYIQQGKRYVLFREKQHPFTEDILFKLVEHKITTVYVTEEGLAEFQKYYFSLQEGSTDDLSSEGFSGPVFSKPENVEKYYETFFNYYAVEKKTLIPGSIVGFNVYEKKELEADFYFGPDSQDKQDKVPDDIRKHHLPLVIHKEDIHLYKEYLEALTKEYSKHKTASQELRCSIIRENSKLVIRDVLEDPRSGVNIKKCSDTVESLIDAVLYNENNFYNLLKITSYDYYTYAHSLNVCTLGIGLAIAVNMDKSDINELALGAVLHDIGKSLVDPHIINKPGRLTEKEFKEVKQHVVDGKALLERSNANLSRKSYYAVLQHHEKMSGKGYPYALKGDQINLFGRITAIVDFYDALTTKRPYKKASNPFETLQLISECCADYDPDLLKEFVMMLGQQAPQDE